MTVTMHVVGNVPLSKTLTAAVVLDDTVLPYPLLHAPGHRNLLEPLVT